MGFQIRHAVLAVLGGALASAPASAQEPAVVELGNPSFEAAEESGVPSEWRFVARPAGEQAALLDPTDPMEGETSAFLDCSEGSNEFTNLMQSLDATPMQGQRVRFRAAVRTAELTAATRVQLWFRVDRTEGMGAFDNMQDRPIQAEDWEYFDIVLDVSDNATRLNVGMFVIGPGKAWVDDASLEVVGEEVASTSWMTPAMMDAMAVAEEAPVQPFFSPWLLLALVACLLFALSQRGGSPTSESKVDGRETEKPKLGAMTKFAFRFSMLYWLLYNLPQPLPSITPEFAQPAVAAYQEGADSLVRWTGAKVFEIEGEMVGPNGSGDTTYAYIKLLLCFAGAAIVAGVWSLVDRRATDYRITKDWLRSYLRYVVASIMIGYGLAKLGVTGNQFSPPGGARLEQTYGDSSPMGLLWTFMGTSQAYTRFAGACELLGGVLLLFRRTTTAGAFVVFAVMVNVAMMNLCYDVPVKQYSLHIVAMAGYLLLPELRRLSNLLLWNRPAAPVELGPPYPWKSLRVLQFLGKLALIVFLAGIPLYEHVRQELPQLRALAKDGGTEPETEDGFRLTTRGFRWISEVPFNR